MPDPTPEERAEWVIKAMQTPLGEIAETIETEIRIAVTAQKERDAKVAEDFFAMGTYEAVKKGIAAAIRRGGKGEDN